jgi:hypothetical protein
MASCSISHRIPAQLLDALSPVNVVCGHYGVGKTNFTVNLACDLSRAGYAVTVADFDVVNPYFRATEQRAVLEAAGVKLISPVFAESGSSLDSPSLRGTLIPAMQTGRASWVTNALDSGDLTHQRHVVLVDAGGDDVGATALGRFGDAIRAGVYSMFYVVNQSRSQTRESCDAFQVLREIEDACGLRATGFVDNTHLKGETSEGVLVASASFCREFADQSNLALVCKTVPHSLFAKRSESEQATINQDILLAFKDACMSDDILYPVDAIVKNPWE